ncbi:outer membrane beta-barrel family protein [Mucilaginibacter agri]|uniref:TonB-dependent receptor n=1 Tax=Mucilaginibacter agri TaxID=2695265 RepID=A0A966DTK3_9SPHI|nr:outer membrane beta-barrel family protein [Mucilaginibacter agri]NCD69506.1 TonB-dependent receptor [Mucilaginibacter agri]
MKPIINKFICFICLVTGFSAARAQSSVSAVKVSGSLVNEQGKPADFATVSLLKAKDSVVVKGGLSNESGAYSFAGIRPGNYVIKATMVGYQKGLTPITVGAVNVIVPVIKMLPASKTLSAVNIVATKPLIERRSDRTVVNVENSVLAAGNSAMEILEKAPGVSVDKDDNISLNGKQGVTVMINDKLTYLSAAQLATLLRSTDGNTIQSLEIISNPSAKYDAAGNSGIINIKLKKNRESGTNGNLTATAALGKYFRDNTSLTLNHKQGKFSFFGTLSRGDNKRENNIRIDRSVPGADSTTYFSQKTKMLDDNHYNNYRVGADFAMTSKNTLGFVASGYYNPDGSNNNNTTYIGSQPSVFSSYQNTLTTISQTYKNFAFNINDKLEIDTAGQALSVDLDYSKFNNNSNAQYDTYYYNINGTPAGTPSMLRNQTPSTIDIRTAKADYTLPFNKTTKLEFGAKYSNVKTDNDLEAQISTPTGYVNDSTRTNHFIYTEKIGAGYLNFSKSFKKTSIQFGVRAENTTSNGNLVSSHQVVDRSYLNFFPSAFINHTINDKNEIGFNYSRRIDRPSYEDLNPFVYYLDQYTYMQGNPFLKPQYTNSFEVNYTYNHNINVTFGYSHTTDVITEVIVTDTVKKATYQTTLNLQSQDSYNLNLNVPYTFTKWWSGNVNFTGFYLGFKSGNDTPQPGSVYNGYLNGGKAAFQLKTTSTFKITKTFKAEFMTNYQSELQYGYYTIKPQYNFDGGLSKSFADKKLNIKLSVSDIFNTRKNNVIARSNDNIIDIHQKNETRVGRLTFTYNFGNSKIKSRDHQTGADDEKNRVKNQ